MSNKVEETKVEEAEGILSIDRSIERFNFRHYPERPCHYPSGNIVDWSFIALNFEEPVVSGYGHSFFTKREDVEKAYAASKTCNCLNFKFIYTPFRNSLKSHHKLVSIICDKGCYQHINFSNDDIKLS
jgi:hypothetical protein